MCFIGLSLALLFSCSFISALYLSSCLAATRSNVWESGIAPTVELLGRLLGEGGGLGKSKLMLSFEGMAGDGAGDCSGVDPTE